jgi:hypothetical protein
MKNIETNLKPAEMYREIYDRHIGVKQFEQWLKRQLQLAYDQGVRDADAPPSYDDVSKSQYD